MPKFNLMHCLLHPRAHGLIGYTEVIDTVGWGLKELGHDVRRSVNAPDSECINIVFGAQVLALEAIQALPANSIIYNFEQIRNVPESNIKPQIRFIAGHFQIWDYSAGNAEAWARLGAGDNLKIVPVGYAPILSRIAKPAVQDIDILIYGVASGKRLRAFEMLSQAGLSVVFVSGLYGEARDGLIARSKLMLNINLHDHSRIFEIVRVSYLLANKKAVLSIAEEDAFIEEDIKSCIKFTTLENLVKECVFLAENAPARSVLEDHGFNVFIRRDIRKIVTETSGGYP